MAEAVHADVVEQILLRLDPKLLIRFKRVCKSWHSLITSPRFVSLHLNRSYNKDRYNNKRYSRRISFADEVSSNGLNRTLINKDGYHSLVGSSNGLVCIFTDLASSKLIVCNPLTREVRQLPALIGSPLCWGFGYDLSKDDYTVVVGVKKGKKRTCFQVLSLKSNVWRVIGEIEYRLFTKELGVLCNGSLHWIVRVENRNVGVQIREEFIISYDLSKDEFEEIPQPEDARYNINYYTYNSYLGIVKECLCIIREDSSISEYRSIHDIWMMKKYNVKESWKLLSHHNQKNIVHCLSLPDDGSFFLRCVKSRFSKDSTNRLMGLIDAPIFVQSLISPHKMVLLKMNVNGGDIGGSSTTC